MSYLTVEMSRVVKCHVMAHHRLPLFSDMNSTV